MRVEVRADYHAALEIVDGDAAFAVRCMVALESKMGHPENESREVRASRIGEFERVFAAALIAGDEVAAETTIREAMSRAGRSATTGSLLACSATTRKRGRRENQVRIWRQLNSGA